MIDEKYKKLLEEFKANTNDLDKYSTIICHKSAFGDDNTSIIARLEKYCQNNNKTLVFFSGGIDTNYYLKDDDFELLEVNSKVFYSPTLEMFLNDFRLGKPHALILSYGDKWKVNILLNTLEKLNIYIGITKKEKVLYSAFMRDNKEIEKVKTLNIELYEFVVDKNRIDLKEIVKYRDSVLNYINESLYYE